MFLGQVTNASLDALKGFQGLRVCLSVKNSGNGINMFLELGFCLVIHGSSLV